MDVKTGGYLDENQNKKGFYRILMQFCQDFSSGGSRKFWWGGFEAQNLKNSDVFTKIESDFSAEIGNSNVFFAQIQLQKKKKVFTKIETDFSPDSLRLGRWGGMHPKMEPNYSKQRLIFPPKSLLLGWWGGCIPPPLNPPLDFRWWPIETEEVWFVFSQNLSASSYRNLRLRGLGSCVLDET